jgi:hypothetical protein
MVNPEEQKMQELFTLRIFETNTSLLVVVTLNI